MSRPQLRMGQIVTTFGPGAMVDLPDRSVIVAGLDHWNYDHARIRVIDEPRLVAKLERLLGISGISLREPPAAVENERGFTPSITAWRFPKWFIVQHPETTAKGHRARRLVHEEALDGDKFKHRDGRKSQKYDVVPVRFVRACRNGHVGDIDWSEFIHGGPTGCVRDLWLEERGTSGDLDEIWARCDCGADRPMSQAARLDLRALGHCNGSRPWLGPGTRESCGELNRLLIRSASNAYFSQRMSVISIPDLYRDLDALVKSLWDDFFADVENDQDLARVLQKPTVRARVGEYDAGHIRQSIERIRRGEAHEDRPVKEVEFEALADAAEEIGEDAPDGDFFARALSPAVWDAPWMTAVRRVVLVHRLREVIAQLGFTRFEAAGPDIQGELALDVQRAPLSCEQTWLPAVENRGEGLFLEFNPEEVAQWLARSAVHRRRDDLVAGFASWQAEHPGSTRPFPELAYYMLHSVSHLLMSAIALECGYPAASLRERIYVGPERYGILIYTGSPDAEGTLGGLVEAGRSISRHMHRALEMAALCSNDPVCAAHRPTRHDFQHLLGSACHGCLLIAETSCEQQNDFLDRALVVPTVEALGAEFFPAVV